MKVYRITYLIGKLNNGECPPPFIYTIFPNFNGWQVTLNEHECIVHVPDNEVPVNLGPLVKIEEIG